MNYLLSLKTKISKNMQKGLKVHCRKNQRLKKSKNNKQKMDRLQDIEEDRFIFQKS